MTKVSKQRVYSSSQGCHTATGTHMPYGITPGRGDIPALTQAEAGTRLSDPRGMQGWVDLALANLSHILDTVRHLNIQPQQTTACTERPSAHRHHDQKMRSHHTGVSPSSLAPCYCPHSFQNRTADFQNTYYPSAELHSRPSPSSLLITTTQVL